MMQIRRLEQEKKYTGAALFTGFRRNTVVHALLNTSNDGFKTASGEVPLSAEVERCLYSSRNPASSRRKDFIAREPESALVFERLKRGCAAPVGDVASFVSLPLFLTQPKQERRTRFENGLPEQLR